MCAEHADGADVVIGIELPSSIAGPLQGDGLARDAEGAVAQEIATIMRDVGVAGTPRVDIAASAGASPGGEPVTRPLRMTVNGTRCRFPAEDVERTAAYVRGELPRPGSHLVDGFGLPSTSDAVIEFLRMLSGQAVRRAPGILLATPAVGRYASDMRRAVPLSHDLDEARLKRVLKQILDLRIRLPEPALFASAFERDGSLPPVAESLIADRRSRAIELHAPRDFMRDLVSDGTQSTAHEINELSAAMGSELGLTLPEIRFVQAEELEPRTLRFKINDLPGLPWIGLPRNRSMVAAEPASLEAFDIKAEPLVNPGTGTGASLIDAEDSERARSMGLLVYNQFSHALLCLSAAMRAHAGCFVDERWLDRALDGLAVERPALVDAVRSSRRSYRLVALLRRLVSEGLSIADLPLVLGLFLEHRLRFGAWPVCASAGPAASTEGKAPNVEAYVRAGMPRAVLRRWGSPIANAQILTLIVSQDVESAVSAAGSSPMDEATRDALLDSLQEEVDFVPTSSGLPVLVTSAGARSRLRDAIADEFPRIGVISRIELAPEAKPQWLGELRLPSS